MVRGGSRKGAGRKSAWKHSKTELIRVPAEFVDQVLDFARRLDDGELVRIELVKNAVQSDQLVLLSGENSHIFCPKCGSSHLHKDGKQNGKQRYQCQSCKRKFSLK